MKKFPKLEIGLRGTARQMFRTVELAGQEQDDNAAPVVQFVADHREGVDPEALARLFAAAPEMLAALESLLSLRANHRSGFKLSSLGMASSDADETVRALAYIENLDALTGLIESAVKKAGGA